MSVWYSRRELECLPVPGHRDSSLCGDRHLYEGLSRSSRVYHRRDAAPCTVTGHMIARQTVYDIRQSDIVPNSRSCIIAGLNPALARVIGGLPFPISTRSWRTQTLPSNDSRKRLSANADAHLPRARTENSQGKSHAVINEHPGRSEWLANNPNDSTIRVYIR